MHGLLYRIFAAFDGAKIGESPTPGVGHQALASPLTQKQGRSISKFEETDGYSSVNYREYAARRLMSLESGALTLRGKEKNKILGPAPIGIPPMVLRASCLFLLENTA